MLRNLGVRQSFRRVLKMPIKTNGLLLTTSLGGRHAQLDASTHWDAAACMLSRVSDPSQGRPRQRLPGPGRWEPDDPRQGASAKDCDRAAGPCLGTRAMPAADGETARRSGEERTGSSPSEP